MPSLPLHGQERLRLQLRAALSADSLPSAILIHGPPGVGKQRTGLWLAQLLLCLSSGESKPCGECDACKRVLALQHPDMHWYFPRPRLKESDATPEQVDQDLADGIQERIKAGMLYPPSSGSDGLHIATVRAILRHAQRTPAMGARKVFLVGDADRMVSQEGADQAANAFLKLLEEPPADTRIILTSSVPGALLPTIRSRVVAFRAQRLTASEMRSLLSDPALELSAGELLGRLHEDPTLYDAFIRGGAPGALISLDDSRKSYSAARQLLESAEKGRAQQARECFALGAGGARGAFSDVLMALSELLRDRMQGAVRDGRPARALAAARGVQEVEDALQLARGNITPQLLGMKVVRTLSQVHP